MLLSYKSLLLEAQQRLQEEGCVVDIRPHGLKYVPRTTIKSQALVDLHIISIMDIQRIHTNNIAIMLIIQIFSPKHLMHSSSKTLAQLSKSLFSRKTLKR